MIHFQLHHQLTNKGRSTSAEHTPNSSTNPWISPINQVTSDVIDEAINHKEERGKGGEQKQTDPPTRLWQLASLAMWCSRRRG